MSRVLSGAAPLGCTNVAAEMYIHVEYSNFLCDQRPQKILKPVECARQCCVCKKMRARAVTLIAIVMATHHAPQLQISERLRSHYSTAPEGVIS